MKGGDKIIKIGDYDVADLAGMTDALRAYRPGDKVVIVVVRDGKTMGLDVTLGKRGG
jgi:S1-C subfamily serine protease